MSHYRSPQTPGIDAIQQVFTGAEETRLIQLAGIVGVQGDVIYHNGSTWTKLAAGTNGHVLTTAGVGANPSWTGAGSGDMVLASIQTVTGAKQFGTIGGAVGKFILAGSTSGSTIVNAAAVAGATTITLPGATDTLVGKATTDVLTNKSIDADTNTITNIENADIKAAAAIAVNKLAALTASQITGTDVSGFLVSLAVATYPSLTELTYVKGVTSAIQTQIDGKAATNQAMFIGTTSVAINRGSAALTLAGITLTTPNIGTPSAGVLTNCTGLPAASVLAGSLGAGAFVMSSSLQLVTIELGHATDTTISRASAGVAAIEGNNIVVNTSSPTLATITTTGNIELGHATDTTLSRSAAGVLAVEGVVIPSISSTNTLTNKRVTKRTGTVADSATPTINTDNVDFYSITALTTAITSMTTNLSGTPTEAQTLWIAITGTAARAITWGTSFEASTVALPTTTVTTARLDVGFIWNTVTSKWRCVASA